MGRPSDTRCDSDRKSHALSAADDARVGIRTARPPRIVPVGWLAGEIRDTGGRRAVWAGGVSGCGAGRRAEFERRSPIRRRTVTAD